MVDPFKKMAEAQKAYERAIQEFADQQEIVAEASIRLSKLKQLETTVQAKDIVIRKLMNGTGAGYPIGNPSPNGKYFAYVKKAY